MIPYLVCHPGSPSLQTSHGSARTRSTHSLSPSPTPSARGDGCYVPVRVRRAICHPDRGNHDGKGLCSECAVPITENQQVSPRKTNCIGDNMVLLHHPRRGRIRVA